MIHMAPYTQSSIVSKSIARGGGRAGYRGEVRVDANAHHSANTVRCDALLVDTKSRSDTYPRSTSASTTCSSVTRRRSRRSAKSSCST
jgi:Fe-S cluster assembly scaffold protein SufB